MFSAPALVAALFVLISGWCAPTTAHAAGVSCGAAVAYGTEACFIDTAFDPQALCNDGTVPAFWYRPGIGAGINQWVIWLQGGGTCDDQTSCAARGNKVQAAMELTSNGFSATPGQGLISPKPTMNPSLHNANTVLIHYCTSDSWTGNHLATVPWDPNNSATAWNFDGRRVALAAIRSVAELLPSFASASQIVLGGDSSGGIGVVLTYNDILPLLPSGAAKLMTSDAGLELDIGQFDQTQPAPYIYPNHPNAYETDIQTRLVYWNARGDAVCDATAVTKQEHADCDDSTYVLQHGFINAPTFVSISLLDEAQVTDQLCPSLYGFCPTPSDPNAPPGIYATAFAQRMAVRVQGVGTQATYTAYSPDQYLHVITNLDKTFPTPYQFPSGNIAPRDAFDAWLANPGGPRQIYLGNGPGVGPGGQGN